VGAGRSFRVVLAVLLACGVALPAASAEAPRVSGFPPGTDVSDLPSGIGWGDPHSTAAGGAVGDGTTAKRTTPVPIHGGSLLDGVEISDVDTGASSGCALAVGRVYCWGSNDKGQLGNGLNIPETNSPVAVGGALLGKQVTAISVGGRHACALADQRAYCWGSNFNSQLGIGDPPVKSSNTPVEVGFAAGVRVSAISAGYNHTCAIADGRVWCWGQNVLHQLGDGTTISRILPTPIVHGVWDATPVDSISAGGWLTCIVSAGRGYCWGNNKNGQAGVDSDEDVVTQPTAISTVGSLKGLTVKAISAGTWASCLVAGKTNVRTAYCSGHAAYTGSYPLQDRRRPSDVDASGVLAGQSISTISTGEFTSCVVADGQGHCWASGRAGQLGDGNDIDSILPTTVDTSGITKKWLVSIATENYYSTAVAVRPRTFGDVLSSYVFYDDITWAAGAGVAQGNPDNTFHPAENISRQAMAAFVFRAVNPGVPDPECADGTRVYSDVKTMDDFCGPIEWLAKSGIVGELEPKFSPGKPAFRGVVADWIFRAHHPGVADQVCAGGTRLFTDVAAGDDDCGNIEWLARTGITNGYDDGKFRPEDPVHRDAMAAFFHRQRALINPH